MTDTPEYGVIFVAISRFIAGGHFAINSVLAQIAKIWYNMSSLAKEFLIKQDILMKGSVLFMGATQLDLSKNEKADILFAFGYTEAESIQ